MADESPIIGVDLGTTTSCVAVLIDSRVHVIKNEFGLSTTPSVIYYDKKLDPASNQPVVIVGKEACNRMARYPTRTLYTVKRLIGRKYSQEVAKQFNYQVISDSYQNNLIRLSGDVFLYPEQSSAEVLKKMKKIAENYLGCQVNRAVITVPAYFTDSQRYATRVAASLAGLETIRMINEPTAGCLCYGLDQLTSDCQVLVYDMGGGTTDVSLLSLNQGLFEVIATSGDSDLGGVDFDQKLSEYVVTKYQISHLTGSQKTRLLRACEKLKIQLSASDQASLTLDDFYPSQPSANTLALDDNESDNSSAATSLTIYLTYQEWLPVISELLIRAKEPVLQVLRDSQTSQADIQQIVLIGGSSRLRPVQLMIQHMFPASLLNQSLNPDEAVAVGAAIQANMLQKTPTEGQPSATSEMVLVDVTPLSLGIETEGGLMSVIIARNTPIPCSRTAYYTTVTDQQTVVNIDILHGERPFTADNQPLGRFQLTDIQPVSRGLPKIRVDFQINVDGILEITAVDENSQVQQQLIIDSSALRVTAADLENRLAEAKQAIYHDEAKRELAVAQQSFLQLIRELSQLVANSPTSGDTQPVQVKLDWYQQQADMDQTTSQLVTVQDYQRWREEIKQELMPQLDQLFQRPQLIANPVEAEQNEDELNQFLENLFVNP